MAAVQLCFSCWLWPSVCVLMPSKIEKRVGSLLWLHENQRAIVTTPKLLYQALSAQSDLPSYRLVSPAGGQGATGFWHKVGKLVVENRTPSWLELVQAGISGKCVCTQSKGQGLVVLVSHASLSRGKGWGRKLAQHQSATLFVKYVDSGFFFSAIKLQMPKVSVIVFSLQTSNWKAFIDHNGSCDR